MAHNLPIGDLMSYYGRLLLSRPVLPALLVSSLLSPTHRIFFKPYILMLWKRDGVKIYGLN